MKTIDTSLEHRVILPESSSAKQHPTVVLLHGRGADEEDLLGLAPYLDERLMFISVRAPFPFPFGGGYTWYDVGSVGEPEPAMFKSSYDALLTFVADSLIAYPVDPKRVYLLGFSMGTVMSYALSLTRPSLFRGVVANSGYVPEGTHLMLKWNDLSGIDFLVTHGILDPVIPVAMGRRARDLFHNAGASCVYKEYPMAHEISQESLAGVAAWISDRLNERKDS